MLKDCFMGFWQRTFYLLALVLFVFSCTREDNLTDVVESTLKVESFAFLKSNNPQLCEDIFITMGNDSVIETLIPHTGTRKLIASFSGKFAKVEVGGAIQESGITQNDFNQPVRYYFTNAKGDTLCYTLHIKVDNGLPIVEINTETGSEIDSKTEYVNAQIRINNDNDYLPIDSLCQVRGRGHGSWESYKKPYKIKFNKRTSVFGNPACKDWVLLSMNSDKSLIRTSLMFEVSRASSFSFTSNYKYVDLYINNKYRGVYLLTDQLEEDKNRIKIEKDGFFIEQDKYYYEEPLFFLEPWFYYFFVFKYPNPDKGEIKENDDGFVYIRDLMTEMGRAIKSIETGDILSYRGLIDVSSFAKWYMDQQVLANYDVNYYYIIRNREAMIEAGPLWDAEWSLGNGGLDLTQGWYKPPYEIDPKSAILYQETGYFKYLTQDPYFNKIVYEEWLKLKPCIPTIIERMEQLRALLKCAQENEFELYPILGKYYGNGLHAFETWEEEVDYVIDFFKKRTDWLDSYFANAD